MLSSDGLGKLTYILSKNISKKISYSFLIIFILVYPILQNYSGFTYTPKPILEEKLAVSDFKSVSQFVYNKTNYTELIIISHPTSTAYYYLGRVDYWLNTHSGETILYTHENNGILKDNYANATIIDNLDKLKKIVNDSKSGIIIIEKSRYRFINKSIKSWISFNLEQIDSVSDNYIDVYYWNHTYIDDSIIKNKH